MLLYQGRIAGQVTLRRAPLLDTVVEPEELVFFFVLRLQAENAETFRTDRHVRRPESAVQPVYVRWVDGVLHRLQPVAIDHCFNYAPPPAVFARQHVPARQQRRRRRTHIGEQQAGQFFDRIGCVLDTVLVGAVRRLGWLLQATSRSVEFPTVIRAADALLIDVAVYERRPPMRAMLGDKSVSRFRLPPAAGGMRNTIKSSPRIRTPLIGFSAVNSQAAATGCQ